ncbi:MAG: Ig-like domain-containing protein [Erysipelotrichaceae bacterium]|nr:Ig-like domain-containing protein [Erysipelotrichaceae bacterium]
MKKLVICLLACLLCLSLSAPVKAATIKLSATSITLKAGSTKKLKVLNTKKKVTWSSTNKKIAKVSSKGTVTAVKAGGCTIKAKVSGKTYKCKVTVTAWLSATSATIYSKRTKTLTLKGTTIKSVSSSDTDIATVAKTSSTKAKITTKAVGSAKITVVGSNSKTYQCSITVKYYPLTVGKVASGQELLNKTSGTFKTSKQGVALVDKKYGIIVPVEAGVCTISNDTSKIQVKVTDNKNVKVGVDISKWQGSIDVKKLKENNLDFAILRAGHGNEKDTKFASFVEEIYDGKLPFGIYWYLESHSSTRDMNEADATKEAEALVKILNKYKNNEDFNDYFQLPIFMDLEDKSLYATSHGSSKAKRANHIQKLCEAFIAVLEENGYTNYSIYAGKYYTENNLNNAFFASFAAKYWHARYNYVGAPTVTINGKTISPNIWQIGSGFTVDGTGSTNTDVNYWYK